MKLQLSLTPHLVFFPSQQDLRVKLEHEREKRYVGILRIVVLVFFSFSSVQALTLPFGSFLLSFAMHGILCLEETTVTRQCRKGRKGKIPALTFSCSFVFWARTGHLRDGKTKKEKAWEREWAKSVSAKSVSSVSSLPGTPHVNTSSCVFWAVCPPSHLQWQQYSRGKACLHSHCYEQFFHPGDLQAQHWFKESCPNTSTCLV